MTEMAGDKKSERKSLQAISWKLRQAVQEQARTSPHQVAQIVLESHFNIGCITLRGQSTDKGLATLIRDLSGFGLPVKANTFREKNGMVLCWMRPDEWLWIGDAAQETALAEQLRAGVAERKLHAVATAVGGTYALLQLSGRKASALLGKGCTLDLHLRSFAIGGCAQSLLAKAPVLLWRPAALPGKPAWEILVRRSFSEYLGLWLLDAGEEFGLQARL